MLPPAVGGFPTVNLRDEVLLVELIFVDCTETASLSRKKRSKLLLGSRSEDVNSLLLALIEDWDLPLLLLLLLLPKLDLPL